MDVLYLCLLIITPTSAYIPPEWIFLGNHSFTIFVNYHVYIVCAKNKKRIITYNVKKVS